MIIKSENDMFATKRACSALIAVPICLGLLLAGDAQIVAQDAIPEVVVKGLNNPSGVAIQPETGHVFVSDSGAGRVVRVIDGKIEAVITGFSTEDYGTNPTYKIGPLGLLFLDKETLVVGGGGLPDGEDAIRVFKVPDVGEAAIDITAISGKAFVLPQATDDTGDELPGEGNFYGLARGINGIFVTGSGDDKKGWVSYAEVKKNQITELKRLIPTKSMTEVDAPVAATISPQSYLVIGQMGETQNAKDSLLTFYSQSGTKLGIYRTGLNDITGLAYGPRHGRLFALDFNWANPKKGGLYKLVDTESENQCEAVLMSQLEKPTALAFTLTGDCYITLAGSPGGQPDGRLILIRQLDIDTSK